MEQDYKDPKTVICTEQQPPSKGQLENNNPIVI